MRVTVGQNIIHVAKLANAVKEIIYVVDPVAQGGYFRRGASRQVTIFSLRQRNCSQQRKRSQYHDHAHNEPPAPSPYSETL